jgi:short-subunit dehydrogenase
VSPGVTATEFLQVSGQKPTLYQRLAMMQSADVARAGVQALLRRKPSTVPGLVNKLPAFLMRFTPRRLQARAAHLTMNVG